MNYLFDTNVFVLLVKNEKFGKLIEQMYQTNASENLYYFILLWVSWIQLPNKIIGELKKSRN
jgi:hypothetical protein